MTVTKRDLLAVQQTLIEEFDDINAKMVADSSLKLTRDGVPAFDYLVKLVEVVRSKDADAPPLYMFVVGTSRVPPLAAQRPIDYPKLMEVLKDWMAVYTQAQERQAAARKGISKL